MLFVCGIDCVLVSRNYFDLFLQGISLLIRVASEPFAQYCDCTMVQLYVHEGASQLASPQRAACDALFRIFMQ